MNSKDLTITMLLDVSPKKVFDAVNDVRGWWSPRLKGDSDALGATFTYAFLTPSEMEEALEKTAQEIQQQMRSAH